MRLLDPRSFGPLLLLAACGERAPRIESLLGDPPPARVRAAPDAEALLAAWREPALACAREVFGADEVAAADAELELIPRWTDFYLVASHHFGALAATGIGGFADREASRAFVMTSVLGPDWKADEHGLPSYLARALVHELAHLVSAAALPGDPRHPPWLEEGIAEWAAARVVHEDPQAARPAPWRAMALGMSRAAILGPLRDEDVETTRAALVQTLQRWDGSWPSYFLAQLLLCRYVARHPDARPEGVVGELLQRALRCVEKERGVPPADGAEIGRSPDGALSPASPSATARPLLEELVTPEFVAWIRHAPAEWVGVIGLLDRTRGGLVQCAGAPRMSANTSAAWPALAYRARPIESERAILRGAFRMSSTGRDDELHLMVGAELAHADGTGDAHDVLITLRRGGPLRVWRRLIHIGPGFAQDLSELAHRPLSRPLLPDEPREIEARVLPGRLRILLDGAELLDLPVEGLAARGRRVGIGAGAGTTVLWERLELVGS